MELKGKQHAVLSVTINQDCSKMACKHFFGRAEGSTYRQTYLIKCETVAYDVNGAANLLYWRLYVFIPVRCVCLSRLALLKRGT